MLNNLLIKLASTQVPKLVRHLLVFVGAWMAAKGFEGDINAPVQFITGVIILGAGYVWSVTVKTPLNAAWYDLLVNAAAVGARKLVSILAAFLVANGVPASGDMTTEALLVLFANWFASMLTDPKTKPKA